MALAIHSGNAIAIEPEAYYIYQTSGIVGDQDIYITRDGIKIVNKTSGLVTIARAPLWKVVTFHDRTKSICTEPLTTFKGYIPSKEFVSTGSSWAALPFIKSDNKLISGINSTVFTTPNSFTTKQLKDWQREFADSKFIKSARYCVSSDLNTSPKIRTAVCKFYGLADKGGLPLEFKYHDLGGNLHVGLITTTIKKISEASIDCAIPEGYKIVKDHRELHKLATANKTREKQRRPLL